MDGLDSTSNDTQETAVVPLVSDGKCSSTITSSEYSYIIDETFIVKFMTHFKLNKTLFLRLERQEQKNKIEK